MQKNGYIAEEQQYSQESKIWAYLRAKLKLVIFIARKWQLNTKKLIQIAVFFHTHSFLHLFFFAARWAAAEPLRGAAKLSGS